MKKAARAETAVDTPFIIPHKIIFYNIQEKGADENGANCCFYCKYCRPGCSLCEELFRGIANGGGRCYNRRARGAKEKGLWIYF